MEEVVLIILASIAFLALSLWIDYLIAKEFYKAACDKGYTQKKYLWIPFVLGPIGYILVVALPDRSNATNTSADELPEI